MRGKQIPREVGYSQSPHNSVKERLPSEKKMFQSKWGIKGRVQIEYSGVA